MSNRREELRLLVRLGLPIIAAQMFQMGIGVMDTVMAGRLSAEDLAGVALGGNVWFPTQMLLLGPVMATTPIISQLDGAGRVAEVGEVARQGAWVALLAALVLIAVLNHAESFYRLLGVDPSAVAISLPYLRAVSCGVPAMLGYFLLRYVCEGLGRTRPAMVIAALALLVKAPLNYAFVYGHWGAPRLGGVGCGWATAIVMWFEFAAILVVVRTPFYRKARLFERFSWPAPSLLLRFARIGLPIGATAFFEVAVFGSTTLLVGRLGAEAVAAQQIAFNLNGLTFMIPLAFGMAATIRVGHNVGAGNPRRARTTAEVAMGVSIAFAFVAGALLWWLRRDLAALYTTDPEVHAIASGVLLFVAAYQIVDDTQVTAIGALRGYKDTRVPMWIALFGYWFVGLPSACALGFGWGGREPWGIYGFWTGLTLGLATVAVLVSARLLRLSADPARVRTLSQR